MTDRFAFGANWKRYLARHYSEQRLDITRAWLVEFLGLPDLAGRSFLDIGCGSGLHSLAALRAGADQVVSFDYDPDSVAATRSLWEREGRPARWQVMQGSALDETFMAGLGEFDIVYSWGVLHHTGDMWRALELAVPCIAPTGLFYLALYAREQYHDTEAVLALKRRYHGAGPLQRVFMEAELAWSHILQRRPGNLLRLPALAREYRESRGMAILPDIRDWLGGWPMEFASIAATHGCLAAHGLAMVRIAFGQANTEYLFQPVAQAAAEGRPVLRPENIALARLPVLRSPAELPAGRDYHVFGAARGGELLLAAGRRAGRPPAGFIDPYRTGDLDGIPIRHPDQFAREWPTDTPVVLSNRYLQENSERLWRDGFDTLFNAHPLVIALARGEK